MKVVDCIKDLNHFLPELRSIWPYVDALRKRNGMVEFGLETLSGEFSWFPYCQSPPSAERYIRALMKIGAI